ncbi:MAG: flagellar hook-associated protein FlgK [Candidatus Lambdaproteobacteria bacterium RIFOXYD2_FULL_50_16]|uniref:Flagellar hook-associated protein 1 n=1 Tax=Candidatus Lambdaproteobacteria bacterium RIFOXYD2_FULL_50_16 TaxID=1817772 RepID=A0A1F6GAY5_9PROT|nr:MAG: flagellar hook-associated protein FlgK [Candidatus Lambdaproteobacteria bacterium RIFOXYD2_FULL_50_16]
MSAAQLGQQTTGHNIANVDTEGFSRQETIQETASPNNGGRGLGVDIQGIRRNTDGFVKDKVVGEQTKVGSWGIRNQVLTEAETVFTDLDGNRLRGALDEFWDSWNNLAHEPESVTMRKTLVSKASALSERFNTFNARLDQMHGDLNGRVQAKVLEVNQLTRQIAELNKQVEQLENQGRPANDARDRRELMLTQLSNLVEVRYFENERGTMEVQVPNGQALVHGRNFYDMTAINNSELAGDFRLGLKTPTGVENDVTDIVKSGEIKELIDQRDGNIQNYQDNIDLMAKELAFRVNSVHSGGTGLNALRYNETSAYALNPEALKQPLPFLQNGFFEIKLYDKDGNAEQLVHVDVEGGKDTVETLIEKINRAAGAYEVDDQGKEKLKEKTPFKATIGADGAVTFQTDMGRQFHYNGDSSNALATLGFNTFFQALGGAGDIRVNQELLDDEMKIAAGYDLVPGDNRLASAMGDLRMHGVLGESGDLSFDEFYNSQVTDIGLKVQDSKKGMDNHGEMLSQYQALSDGISGVNLDEEMANMVKYQRAYESSARYMSTVDDMTQTLINM